MSPALDGLPVTLTAPTVAEMLFCSVYTAEEMARKGELPAFKAGPGWVFPTKALLDRINEIAIDEARRRALSRAPASPRAVAIKTKPTRPNLHFYGAPAA